MLCAYTRVTCFFQLYVIVGVNVNCTICVAQGCVLLVANTPVDKHMEAILDGTPSHIVRELSVYLSRFYWYFWCYNRAGEFLRWSHNTFHFLLIGVNTRQLWRTNKEHTDPLVQVLNHNQYSDIYCIYISGIMPGHGGYGMNDTVNVGVFRPSRWRSDCNN